MQRNKLINHIYIKVRTKILSNFFQIPFEKYEHLNKGDLKLKIDDDTVHLADFPKIQIIDLFHFPR